MYVIIIIYYVCFLDAGHVCEKYNNPADFFLDVIHETLVNQCTYVSMYVPKQPGCKKGTQSIVQSTT